MKKFRAFTLIELVITIGIIAILSGVLVPVLTNTYNKSKDEIVEIANHQNLIIVMRGEEEIERGTDVDLTKYIIIDIEYKDGNLIIYVE